MRAIELTLCTEIVYNLYTIIIMIIITIPIIYLIKTKLHITIGKIIKHRRDDIRLANNLVTFECSPE